ncbi:MAG: SPFH domain-containing protein [Ruminococcaceae bacterium]|nr:SPFH domain-containing protein [Oscillospiraceae bacterium]
MKQQNESMIYDEKVLRPANGWAVLILSILAYIAATVGTVLCAIAMENGNIGGIVGFVACVVYLCIGWIWWLGIKVIRPNEAVVLTLFGKYVGSIKSEGFFFVNPFCISVNPAADTAVHARVSQTQPISALTGASASINVTPQNKKVSLKAFTHDNEKQKINDELGNPIEVGIIVIWRVKNTARAVFNVENYKLFLSTQADSALRDVVRCYPYDAPGTEDKSLRGSSAEIALQLKEELQERVEFAGLEVIEARITHLAYAPEIAAAMLQRQQATAIIEARQKIVDGAVGMVEMALSRISEGKICELDDERKAQMVSNLLVVLCGNRDAQPIVNSGSIY